MAPGETGFVAGFSVWNVARAKCHSYCGGWEESLNRILERLNSRFTSRMVIFFFPLVRSLRGICHPGRLVTPSHW